MAVRRLAVPKITLILACSVALTAATLAGAAPIDDPATQPTPEEIIASVKVVHAPGMGVETDLSAEALKVAIDPTTGKFRPLTAKESRALSADRNVVAGRAATPLKAVEMADGSIRLDLQGRFLNFSTVEQLDDGSLSGQCLHSGEQAFAAKTTEEVRNDR